MAEHVGRDGLLAARTAEVAGPSGTAVAGLIFALIALLVAFYAAFAPRQMVNQNSQAVNTELRQARRAAYSALPPEKQGLIPLGPKDKQSAKAEREAAAKEMRKEIAQLRSDLKNLREQIASGSKPQRVASR